MNEELRDSNSGLMGGIDAFRLDYGLNNNKLYFLGIPELISWTRWSL